MPLSNWHWLTVAGGTFESDTDGTFHCDIPGTFQSAVDSTFDSATDGTFQSDMGGTFGPLLSEKNLPTRIIEKLTHFNGGNISSSLVWTAKNESLKNADGADKLEILKHSGLEIANSVDLKGKDIVLVDDLYMSGITLQFIAMKLKEDGAGKVYGLCLVKSLSNK